MESNVINKSDSRYTRMFPDQIGRHEFPRKKMHSFFCERAFNTNYPKLEKISLAETLSNVINSTILENPQFGKVRGRCYGYFDKFCDWWTSLSTHLKYDWLIMMKLSD